MKWLFKSQCSDCWIWGILRNSTRWDGDHVFLSYSYGIEMEQMLRTNSGTSGNAAGFIMDVLKIIVYDETEAIWVTDSTLDTYVAGVTEVDNFVPLQRSRLHNLVANNATITAKEWFRFLMIRFIFKQLQSYWQYVTSSVGGAVENNHLRSHTCISLYVAEGELLQPGGIFNE